jgi:hypothetical protein
MKEEQEQNLTEPNPPEHPLDLESMEQFVARVHISKRDGVYGIEASKKIIDHLNPLGTGPNGYFIYYGVKVFPIGKMEEILKRESLSIDTILHKDKTTIMGRT